jgi:hypothetical protein
VPPSVSEMSTRSLGPQPAASPAHMSRAMESWLPVPPPRPQPHRP